jgi:predicted  nucleic acid-binding Zn-ribbon protein
VRKVQVLAQLQQIDSSLDRARERLAAVEALLEDRSALTDVEAEHQATQAELHRVSGEQHDLELELADLRAKLEAVDGKLYGGTVRNPKELQDLSNDATQYRGLISTREDRLLELFDTVEAVTQRASDAAARWQQAQARHSESQQSLRAEQAELRRRIGELDQQQAARRAESDPSSLRSYDGLRLTRGGLAVAEVAQRTCQGCRVSLPASLEQRAKTSDDLVICQSCGRILHAGL